MNKKEDVVYEMFSACSFKQAKANEMETVTNVINFKETKGKQNIV